jgi:predicted ribosomally synthesized peptide with nif11-like leader
MPKNYFFRRFIFMNDNEKVAKLKEIFADKEFVEKVLAMETAEEVQAAIKEKGVEISVSEIESVKAELANQASSPDSDEVSDEQLENVAGGFAISTLICGLIIGGAVVAGGATIVNEAVRRRW